MSTRQRFIDYVKNGSDEPFISLQLGGGAGFDAKLAGKLWHSDGTLDDTIRAYEIVGCEPLFNIGLPGLDKLSPEIKKHVNREDTETEKTWEEFTETPYGDIEWKFHERHKTGVVILKYALNVDDGEKVFDIVSWYAEQHLNAADSIPEVLGPTIEKLHKHGAVSVQWNMQPFELFGLASVDNLVLLAKIYPERFRKTCDFIIEVSKEIAKYTIVDAGSDFVFLGGPGSEMLSPQFYKDYLIPDSQKITDSVHQNGGLIYSHICSPIEPFLSMGCYNEMGIDLFETLSPPPVGNVPDLAEARKVMNPDICTRGNIGLDVLLNGSVEDVEKGTIEILEATKGTKHMVAASDYLFYDIPLENAKVMVDTVRNWSR
ncbi:MAG: uroporphyrinogen decarboxylase family protein [Planctomycetota bacterium]